MVRTMPEIFRQWTAEGDDGSQSAEGFEGFVDSAEILMETWRGLSAGDEWPKQFQALSRERQMELTRARLLIDDSHQDFGTIGALHESIDAFRVFSQMYWASDAWRRYSTTQGLVAPA